MGIMRWTLLDRVRKAHPDLPVENTYGYLTKNTRITLGLPKTHCVDAYCIARNLKAVRRGVCLHQRQVRKAQPSDSQECSARRRFKDGTKMGYRAQSNTASGQELCALRQGEMSWANRLHLRAKIVRLLRCPEAGRRKNFFLHQLQEAHASRKERHLFNRT